MDPPSLDAAIQHALAGLYPPFEATAPTILGQVFRVLDSDFQGDGLRLLLDFLIPAKRLCEQVREAACAPHSHRLFLHQGWPLCLSGEIVVHLAPLSPLLLRSGDFFLQAEQKEEQSVCLAIKCLSADLRTVDSRPIPESSYPKLFTPAWLEALNGTSGGHQLHSCLVASEDGIAPVLWAKITSPVFVDDIPQAETVLSPTWESLQLEALDLSSPRELHQTPDNQGHHTRSLALGKHTMPRNKYPRLIKVEQARPREGAFRMEPVASQDLEGDYVALLDLSPRSSQGSPHLEVKISKGCPPQAAPEEQMRMKGISDSLRTLPFPEANRAPLLNKCTSAKSPNLEQKPYARGVRGTVNPEGLTNRSELQAPKAQISGLLSPLPWASSSRTGMSEESAATKTQGALALLDKVVPPRPGPKQASSPHLCPVMPPAAPRTEAKVADRNPLSHQDLSEPTVNPDWSRTSSAPPSLERKFSLLGGQRPAPEAPEKAPFLPKGSWRALCSLSSPKPSLAKSEAGTTQTQTSGTDTDSGPVIQERAGLPEASAGPLGRGTPLDKRPPGPEPGISALSTEILSSGIACLPGGRDRLGRPLLLISTTAGAWEAPWCTVSEVTKLLFFLCSIPRPEDKAKELAFVVDARKQSPQAGLVSALQATQALLPVSFQAATFLFLGEKEAALQLETLPNIQVQVLTSLKTLSHYVDPNQLPPALEGPFPYCHSEWVQFFQKLDPFLADLRQACSLLQASIKGFEKKSEPPGGVQEASWLLSQSKELMEVVLRNPGLQGLQREGGVILARLQQEADRLPFHPDVRSQVAEAAALYKLMEEQLHILVTASNHVLGWLELRVRLGHVQAAIHQVSHWMEQEGSEHLQTLSPGHRSLEAVERAKAEFEDFFLLAAAQYCRGLELSKEAAQLGTAAREAGEMGTEELPELATLTSMQSSFQAKLTHFYMAAERQRTDLDTLLCLHRFCKKIAWFHMDCQDLMAQLQLGSAQKVSSGDRRRLHRYLQRLMEEFPAEKLAAVGLQAASLRQADLGRELWAKAQRTHEAVQTLLDKAVAHCSGPAGPPDHPAHPELRRPVAGNQGRRGLPLQDALSKQRSPKPCWPPQCPIREQSRNLLVGPLPWEAGQWAEPEESPEHGLASLFSWLRPLRRGHDPIRGSSSSSSGTDSQTSLEDSPQTSPPASL